MNLTFKKRTRNAFSLEIAKLVPGSTPLPASRAGALSSPCHIASRGHIPLTMWPCQAWENLASLMDGWMMVVGLDHLLGIAVENPIDRSLGRHRLYALLCKRLLDGSGPTIFAMLGQCLAQGHDDLCEALGRFGRGGSGASAPCCAPGGICCQVAIPPFVEPAFRAGQVPADVLYGVACEVSVDGPLSALFVAFCATRAYPETTFKPVTAVELTLVIVPLEKLVLVISVPALTVVPIA